MHSLLLAVIGPDNTPHGANLTMFLPVIGFVVIAAALFLRFGSRHKIPGHAALAIPRPHPAQLAGTSGDAQFQPDQDQPHRAHPDQGQPEQGQPEQGQPEQGQPEQGQPEQGQPEQGQGTVAQPADGDPEAGP